MQNVQRGQHSVVSMVSEESKLEASAIALRDIVLKTIRNLYNASQEKGQMNGDKFLSLIQEKKSQLVPFLKNSLVQVNELSTSTASGMNDFVKRNANPAANSGLSAFCNFILKFNEKNPCGNAWMKDVSWIVLAQAAIQRQSKNR